MHLSSRRLPLTDQLQPAPQPADVQRADADTGFPSRDFRETRRHIVFTVSLLVLLGLFWKIRHVLGIVYVSGLLAVVLNPVVMKIGRLQIRGRAMPKPLAVATLVVGLALGLFLLCWFGLPPVLNDFRNFLSDAPGRMPVLMARLQRIPMADKIGLTHLNDRLASTMETFASYIFTSLPLWAEHLLDILTL